MRESEKLAAAEGKPNKKKEKRKVLTKEAIELSGLEEKLREVYGTKIELTKNKEKRKIIFEVYSMEEYDRIIEMLLNNGK